MSKRTGLVAAIDIEEYTEAIVNRPRAIATALFLLLISQLSVAQQSSSPREQLKQYVADLQKNPDDRALREKIIHLALTITPKPSVPPEAIESEGAAEFAFKISENYADAARQYEKALLSAPWVAADYFNLGVAQEKADLTKKALESFQLYLIAAPDAEDATDVLKKIGALKHVLEQQETAAASERARKDGELEASRTREREAQQASDRAEEERKARLARIDPLIRSLNGATYYVEQHYKDGGFSSSTYTVTEDIVLDEGRNTHPGMPGQSTRESYPIRGQTFYIDYSVGTSGLCRESYRVDECGYVGTITEKGISFQFVAGGTKRQRLVAGPIKDYIPRQ
jgi:tetratricopeptide (TPR) repeat protein